MQINHRKMCVLSHFTQLKTLYDKIMGVFQLKKILGPANCIKNKILKSRLKRLVNSFRKHLFSPC